MLRHFAASGRAELVLIGARPELGDAIGATTISWSRDREVADLQSLDVGMMPLPDDPWARGKCGFKIIQYMACAVPAVASPVGANRDIVVDGETGLLVEEPAEWRAALERLAANPELRRSVGQAGRARVEQRYSREAVAPRLASLLRRAVSS
jgi:glycosyltransferase involved in cell wall biosynthesis